MGEEAYRRAEVAILPVPYDGTTSYQAGTRNGPSAIIAASRQLEWHDPESGQTWTDRGIVTLPEVFPDFASPERMVARIREAVEEVLVDGKWLMMLGGEHSISTGAIGPVAQRHPGLTVVQIDAHLDLRDEYEGTPYSHASVMRRVHGLPGVSRILQFGIRNVSREELDFCESAGLQPWTMERIRRTPDWIVRALDGLKGPVYLTVDLDGFDPSVIPGVGTPEPGGLLWQEGIDLINAVFARADVVAADVNELCPLAGQWLSDFAAAKLTYHIIGKRLAQSAK